MLKMWKNYFNTAITTKVTVVKYNFIYILGNFSCNTDAEMIYSHFFSLFSLFYWCIPASLNKKNILQDENCSIQNYITYKFYPFTKQLLIKRKGLMYQWNPNTARNVFEKRINFLGALIPNLCQHKIKKKQGFLISKVTNVVFLLTMQIHIKQNKIFL